jgi:hypothetical protein
VDGEVVVERRRVDPGTKGGAISRGRGGGRPGFGGCPPARGFDEPAVQLAIGMEVPDGVRVRVDSSVNEKALRRVLSALRGSG